MGKIITFGINLLVIIGLSLALIRLDSNNSDLEELRLKNLISNAKLQYFEHSKAKLNYKYAKAIKIDKTNIITLDKGLDIGLKKDSLVISDKGVVGKIINVSATKSKLLPVTALNSYTPVFNARTKAKAVVKGDGSNAINLEYVDNHLAFKPGDLLLSNSDNKGFPIAKVIAVNGKMIRLLPIASIKLHQDYLVVL